MSAQAISHPVRRRSIFSNDQQTEPKEDPQKAADERFESLFEMEHGVRDRFRELKPKIESARSLAIAYLRLGPIPLEEDEQKFSGIMQRTPALAQRSELRNSQSTPLKPAFGELITYMKQLANTLGHTP